MIKKNFFLFSFPKCSILLEMGKEAANLKFASTRVCESEMNVGEKTGRGQVLIFNLASGCFSDKSWHDQENSSRRPYTPAAHKSNPGGGTPLH